MNPIYERERKSGSRSVRFPAVLTTFNIFLASSALAAMWVTIHRVAETGELRYSVFLSMFSRLAWLEFAASAVMMPAITSGSITGEREKKTLELVLTTRMTPAEIILGKLLSALSGVAVLLLTGTPVFAAVLLFGGVRPRDLALLYLLILLSANVGVMNLLPIPALDGGRLLFLIIEGLTGRKVNRKVEAGITFAGVLLLILLMVFVMYHDIARLF